MTGVKSSPVDVNRKCLIFLDSPAEVKGRTGRQEPKAGTNSLDDKATTNPIRIEPTTKATIVRRAFYMTYES